MGDDALALVFGARRLTGARFWRSLTAAMGKFDRRNSQKMKRRKSQVKKKARLMKVRLANAKPAPKKAAAKKAAPKAEK